MMSARGEQISHLLTPSAIAGYVCWQCHVVDANGLDESRPLKRCKGCRRAVYASFRFDTLWSLGIMVQKHTAVVSRLHNDPLVVSSLYFGALLARPEKSGY